MHFIYSFSSCFSIGRNTDRIPLDTGMAETPNDIGLVVEKETIDFANFLQSDPSPIRPNA